MGNILIIPIHKTYKIFLVKSPYIKTTPLI